MKPMPASATQRPTWSGVRSILTPSEASTSAAPERDDGSLLRLTLGKQRVERRAFERPEVSLPVIGEDLRDGLAQLRLDALVEVHERAAGAFGDEPADAGLAGGHEAAEEEGALHQGA